jgi:twinkle protein
MKTWSDLGIDLSMGATGQKRTLCPACSAARKNSKEKCLSVNADEFTFLCHHCGYSGALQQKDDYIAPVYVKPEPVKTDLPDKVILWFKERGINTETLIKNKIGYESRNIVYPYFDEKGDIVNKKYRTGDKKFRQVSGARKILYGLDQIQGLNKIIIVEGEMDKLALNEIGLYNAVSVPDGAPAINAKSYSSKFSYLDSFDFKNIESVILAVDNDAPGYKLQQELVKRIGAVKCLRVDWPEGCKDANDVLVNYCKDMLKDCIDKARHIPVDGIIDVVDIFTDIEDLYDRGLPGGDSTGWKEVDPYYTVRRGEISIVTGVPSHGKSEWIDAVVCNLATNIGWKTGIFSPENYPVQRHVAKLIQKIVGKPFGDGPTQRMAKEYMSEGKKWVNQYFTFISPPDDKLTVNGILELVEIIIKRKGLDGLIIDPWNEIDHARPPGLTESEYISKALTTIRRFARSNKVHIWVIAHPTKLQRLQDGTYPIPTPYDISGAAHWRNKADIALCVWRDVNDEKSKVQIHIQKVRFREVGKVGLAELKYDIPSGRYISEHQDNRWQS